MLFCFFDNGEFYNEAYNFFKKKIPLRSSTRAIFDNNGSDVKLTSTLVVSNITIFKRDN